MHSPNPVLTSEILKVMPTDQSIAKIYQDMNEREKLICGAMQLFGENDINHQITLFIGISHQLFLSA